MQKNKEDLITTAFVNKLRPMRHKWQIIQLNEMANDPVRQELDRRLVSDILGFDTKMHPDVHEGLALLRKKLCEEPSIHGNKKSRCDLEAEARKLEYQSEDLMLEQGELPFSN